MVDKSEIQHSSNTVASALTISKVRSTLIARARQDISRLLAGTGDVGVTLAQPAESDPTRLAPPVDAPTQPLGPTGSSTMPTWWEEHFMRLFGFETVEELEEWMNTPSDPDLNLEGQTSEN